MFFKRKYVFETEATRHLRRIFNVVILLTSLFIAYSSVCLYLIIDSRNEASEAKARFVESPPDLIVVFTGGPGRIQLAAEKSKEFNQPNVFISGVYEKNSVQTLVGSLDTDLKETSDYIEIDYTARNTVENVLATLKHLRSTRGLNEILIISSDYHITRIKSIFNSLEKPNEQFKFFFSPVMNNYWNYNNIKILYTEVFKIARTKIFMALWDQKTPIRDVQF